MTADFARPLTATERAVLALLLSVEFPGAEELRVQSASAVVVGGCGCGCPSISLEVRGDAPLAPAYRSRLAPVEGVVHSDSTSESGSDWIMLFVDDRRLSYLEYAYVDDAPPTGWPALDKIELVREPAE